MKKKKFNRLALGLYTIHWKDGLRSEGAVGMMANGERWLACTNWTSGGLGNRDGDGRGVWRSIKEVTKQ